MTLILALVTAVASSAAAAENGPEEVIRALYKAHRPWEHKELNLGNPLRFVFAILRSSVSLIDLAIWLDAPLSDDLERLPRFAASAAPAAICCFFDFAGIHK